MKRLTTLALLSALLMASSIQSAFAGPFGIDMGMSLAQIKAVCKTTPKHIQDNVYEITPPKTNDMFETYYVRIDPDYGVYWLKAIGKDLYTNGYGDRVKSTFENLVESIRKTYGKESYIKDFQMRFLSSEYSLMHNQRLWDACIWNIVFQTMLK